jgi:hypothetical protein
MLMAQRRTIIHKRIARPRGHQHHGLLQIAGFLHRAFGRGLAGFEGLIN